MAYPGFHKLHCDFEGEDIKPTFYDTDGSPVYEGPYGKLIQEVVRNNDVAALQINQDCPNTKIFWEAYEVSF